MNDLPGIFLLLLRIGAVTVLYLFLAGMLVTLYRDVVHADPVKPARPIPPIQLLFSEVLDYPDGLQFEEDRVLIGSQTACDCCLPYEGVAQQHALLSWKQNQWWVEPLDKSFSTHLNNLSLEVPTVLTHGDILRCGTVDIILTFI